MSEDVSKYKEIRADLWKEMTITDLYEQLSILRARAYTASIMGNQPLLTQINRGITEIESLLLNRTDNDDTVTIQ